MSNLRLSKKFSLDRQFQLDRFAEGYYKFENNKVGSFKNSKIFTEDSNFMLLHFILQTKLDLIKSSYLKNSRKPDFPEFADCLDDP